MDGWTKGIDEKNRQWVHRRLAKALLGRVPGGEALLDDEERLVRLVMEDGGSVSSSQRVMLLAAAEVLGYSTRLRFWHVLLLDSDNLELLSSVLFLMAQGTNYEQLARFTDDLLAGRASRVEVSEAARAAEGGTEGT